MRIYERRGKYVEFLKTFYPNANIGKTVGVKWDFLAGVADVAIQRTYPKSPFWVKNECGQARARFVRGGTELLLGMGIFLGWVGHSISGLRNSKSGKVHGEVTFNAGDLVFSLVQNACAFK